MDIKLEFTLPRPIKTIRVNSSAHWPEYLSLARLTRDQFDELHSKMIDAQIKEYESAVAKEGVFEFSKLASEVADN